MPFTHFLSKVAADRKKGTAKSSTFSRRKIPMRKRTRVARTVRRGSGRPRQKRRVAFGGTSRRAHINQLSRRVTALSKDVNSSIGELTHRRLQVGSFISSVNKSLTGHVTISNLGSLSNVLGVVPYFDAATNTIVQVDASSTNYQRDYQFKSSFVTATIVNNYTVPCHVRCALVKPRADTTLNPTAAFEAGLVDAGGISRESTLVRWSDSQVYNDLWKTIPGASADKILLPGEKITLTASLGAFDYEQATNDVDNQSFRVADKGCCLFMQTKSTLSHDAVLSNEHGYGKSAVDLSVLTIRKIHYAAGCSLKRSILDSEASTSFTNVATIGAAPVAAFQDFTG